MSDMICERCGLPGAVLDGAGDACDPGRRDCIELLKTTLDAARQKLEALRKFRDEHKEGGIDCYRIWEAKNRYLDLAAQRAQEIARLTEIIDAPSRYVTISKAVHDARLAEIERLTALARELADKFEWSPELSEFSGRRYCFSCHRLESHTEDCIFARPDVRALREQQP